jgi:hypothetical protein
VTATEPIAKIYFTDQVRSKERVRDLAEVYTHDREVNAMLDLVADMFPSDDDPENIDRTFLEPACGHGNFLVEIIRRKLATVTVQRYGEGEEYEYRLLRCFGSTYGIDIDEGNVVDARERMFEVLDKHIRDEGAAVSQEFLDAVSAVLGTNVQQADTLAQATEIELVEYKPVGDGCFLREWSFLEEPEQDDQLDLFAKPEPAPRRDEAPVHYRVLSMTLVPTMGSAAVS